MDKEEKQLRAFGRQVADVRKRQGFSQQKFADKLDVHVTTIARMETGQRWPRLLTLYKMAEVLEVSVLDFFRHTEKH